VDISVKSPAEPLYCALHIFHLEAFCTPFLSCESLKHTQNARVTLVASLHEQRYTSWGNRVLTTSYYYEKSSYLSVRVHVSSLRIIRSGPAAVAFYPFDLSNVDLLSVSHSTTQTYLCTIQQAHKECPPTSEKCHHRLTAFGHVSLPNLHYY